MLEGDPDGCRTLHLNDNMVERGFEFMGWDRRR